MSSRLNDSDRIAALEARLAAAEARLAAIAYPIAYPIVGNSPPNPTCKYCYRLVSDCPGHVICG
jgi:hypothetical protein